MRVSVVIPSYNRGKVLLEAVQSVLAQTHADLELIVVDDGSSDDTEERIRKVTDARLRYVKQSNAGVSVARNHGARQARGEVLAFLDSDDLWKPRKLSADVQFLNAHLRAAAVFSDLEKIHGQVWTASFMRESPAFREILSGLNGASSAVLDTKDLLICLLKEVPIKPSAFTVRKAAFDHLGGFDEQIRASEDWDFFLRLARQFQMGYIDEPLVTLRLSWDSLHFLEAEHGWVTTWRFLCDADWAWADRDLRRAVKSGLVNASMHWGWLYLSQGRNLAASAIAFRGFLKTREVGLLLRALLALLPASLRRFLQKILRKTKERTSGA